MGQRPPSTVGETEVMTTRDQDFGRVRRSGEEGGEAIGKVLKRKESDGSGDNLQRSGAGSLLQAMYQNSKIPTDSPYGLQP